MKLLGQRIRLFFFFKVFVLIYTPTKYVVSICSTTAELIDTVSLLSCLKGKKKEKGKPCMIYVIFLELEEPFPKQGRP